jgi:RHS repeat-associated protein
MRHVREKGDIRHEFESRAIFCEDVHPDTDIDNPRARTEYFTDGLVKAQIDERGNRTEFRYDALGRQIEVIYADKTLDDLSNNPRTRYVYDQAGQQTAVTDALNHTTRYVYDELGRLTKTIFHDQTFTTSEYDSLGRRVAMTDQAGQRTQYRYDSLGRLTGVQDARAQWTEYGYNEVGNLIWQEDANDHRTFYEYDGVGRRTATTLTLGQRSTMTYDAVGNLHSMTDFNGEITVYCYDKQNRLVKKDFNDDPTVSMTYTRNGLVETITDGRGTTQFEYDERDRLIKRIDPDGKWIAYGYDVAGNRTLLKTALGETRYTFDERNGLDTVISASGTTDYDYNAIGLLVHTQLGNGTQENRRYDNLNRLLYLENKEADGDLISSYTYTLDQVGNRKSVQESNGRTVNYTYDVLYRLTQEEVLDAVNGNRTSGYDYDNVGNRLSKTDSVEGTTTYTYDDNDRLEKEVNGQVQTTYTYDHNGNTLTKTEPGQETRYIWDDQNRLVAAEIITATGTKQLEYKYDTSGIRVASKVDGQETRYLIDANQPYAQVLEEYSTDGTVLTSYVYGNDLISQTHDDPQTQVGNTTYYHVDGLGSTTALTDEIGTVVSTSRYDAYGEKTGGTGTISNKYLFTGEQFDENLGDYYLRARYYDTNNGRFTRRDDYEGRTGEPLTLHKYIYTHNNPVNGIDPTGFSMYSIADVSAAHAIANDIIKQYLLFAGRILDDVILGGTVQNFADVFSQLILPNSPLVLRATGGGSVGGGWIWRHESGFGGIGHTIAEHVWVDDNYLKDRLLKTKKDGVTPKYKEVSRFDDEASAERGIRGTILYRKAEIRAWMLNPNAPAKQAFDFPGDGTVVGKGIKQGETVSGNRYGTRIVLKKKNPSSKRSGWSILTSHPI